MSSVKKIVKKVIPKQALKGVEKTYRYNKSRVANMAYGKPAKGMRVVAVTGTNGKTSTCTFINEVLKVGSYKTAVYTTAFTEINGHRKPNRTHMTVASVWSVQNFMAKAKKAKVDWVVLEVTSHALDQYRIYGVPIEIVIITNLTQDHLDYHGTMESYAAAKARLITDFSPKTVILNADDPWYEFFARKVKKGLQSVGQGSATKQIKGLQFSPQGTSFKLIGAKGTLELKIGLMGEYNAYNASMAAIVGQTIGISRDQIAQGVANVDVVPGRLEPVKAGQLFAVLVDYAYTPDALEKVLMGLRPITKGKLRIVFGATGDRDSGKRLAMGEVVAQLADVIYLTDDETYTEDGAAIRSAVYEGVKKAGGAGKCTEVTDRREAIKLAFKEAKDGDVVLLAGIGHQDYRNMGGKKMVWDEREVAKELLKELVSL